MKLGTLAASTLLGVAFFASPSFAQGDKPIVGETSRMSQVTESASVSRMQASGRTPTLHNSRPAAGMLPLEPNGPLRPVSGAVSNAPAVSGDIQNALRRN
jgi:hypothetical protein